MNEVSGGLARRPSGTGLSDICCSQPVGRDLRWAGCF